MITERTQWRMHGEARGARQRLGVSLSIDAIEQVIDDLAERLDFRYADIRIDALVERIADRDVMQLLRHATQCVLLPTLQQVQRQQRCGPEGEQQTQ